MVSILPKRSNSSPLWQEVDFDLLVPGSGPGSNAGSFVEMESQERSMPKRLQFLTMLAMVAMMAALATAHGDKKHIVGTVEKVDSDSVVVKTADGKSVEVKLVANTMYVSRDGKTSKQSDL